MTLPLGILGHLDKQVPIYDRCYSALLNDLAGRGLLDTTLVITAGEVGRTPKLNKDKQGPGRDHWSNCFSLALGGGGVKTGQVIGASDRLGAVPKERPVSVADFGATVYHALGLPDKTRWCRILTAPPFLGQGRADATEGSGPRTAGRHLVDLRADPAGPRVVR